MAAKYLIFGTLVAMASAASLSHDLQRQSSPSSSHQWNQQQWQQDHRPRHQDQDQHSDPSYTFGYAVRDDWSGDRKSQHESRQGDRVRGQYRMVESDGTERVVDYSADDRNGFNAVVRHEPEWHQHPVAIAVRPVAVVVAEHDRHHRQEGQEATSSVRFYQHYAPQPWVISNKIRHN